MQECQTPPPPSEPSHVGRVVTPDTRCPSDVSQAFLPDTPCPSAPFPVFRPPAQSAPPFTTVARLCFLCALL